MAFCTVCSQVELWDEVGESERRQVNIFVEGCKSGAEIDRPFARNVIRDFDIAYLAAFEICRNNVISVNVPKKGLAMFQSSGKDGSAAYRSPRCKSPTAFGSTKQCHAQTALTTPLAI